MRELRIGTWLAAMTALAFGCDDNSRPPDAGRDSGSIVIDSGGGGTDSGPPRDSGTTTDSGGGGGCLPPLSECDVIAQDCGAGSACRYVTPSASEEPRGLCEMPSGTLAEGMACTRSETAPDNCAEGLICSDGFCRQYCCNGSTADCTMGPIGERICFSTADSIVGLCIPDAACDLVEQTGCEAPTACYPLGSAGATTCINHDDVAVGSACEFANDCAPGAVCIDDVCRAFCNAAATPACDTGFMCVGLRDPSGTMLPAGVCVPMT